MNSVNVVCNVIPCLFCGRCLSDNDVDRGRDDHSKEAKAGERKRKDPEPREGLLSYAPEARKQLSWFVDKRWKTQELYIFLSKWVSNIQLKQGGTNECLHVKWFSSTTTFNPPHYHGLSILCQLFTWNWVPGICTFLRPFYKRRGWSLQPGLLTWKNLLHSSTTADPCPLWRTTDGSSGGRASSSSIYLFKTEIQTPSKQQ